MAAESGFWPWSMTAFLAPDIIRMVMDGNQPAGFTSGWCKRNILPSDWAAQRAIVATL